MNSLAKIAAGLDRATEVLAEAASTLAGLGPGGAALASAGPGRLGKTGRALDAQLVAAISARSREAAVAGARLADTAQALRWAAAGYLEADDAARSRLGRAQDDVVERQRRG